MDYTYIHTCATQGEARGAVSRVTAEGNDQDDDYHAYIHTYIHTYIHVQRRGKRVVLFLE
jgi:hypothetical protein